MTLIAAEEHNPLIPPLSEILLGLVAFGILVWIFLKYVFPRFEATYQARREAIEGGLKRAEEAQAEAKQALEEYRAQLADARTEAARIRDAARAEGQRIVDEMRAEAQSEARTITRKARSDREMLSVEARRLRLLLHAALDALDEADDVEIEQTETVQHEEGARTKAA